MIRIGDILEEIGRIESQTLRIPTHILVSQNCAKQLVSQYNDLSNSNAELVFELGEKNYTIEDVGDFLGARIVISLTNRNDFKVLEEITTDS